MRIAPAGNWFIVCTNTQTGKISYPLYDGFRTKVEAESTCKLMNAATSNKFNHTVVGRK